MINCLVVYCRLITLQWSDMLKGEFEKEHTLIQLEGNNVTQELSEETDSEPCPTGLNLQAIWITRFFDIGNERIPFSSSKEYGSWIVRQVARSYNAKVELGIEVTAVLAECHNRICSALFMERYELPAWVLAGEINKDVSAKQLSRMSTMLIFLYLCMFEHILERMGQSLNDFLLQENEKQRLIIPLLRASPEWQKYSFESRQLVEMKCAEKINKRLPLGQKVQSELNKLKEHINGGWESRARSCDRDSLNLGVHQSCFYSEGYLEEEFARSFSHLEPSVEELSSFKKVKTCLFNMNVSLRIEELEYYWTLARQTLQTSWLTELHLTANQRVPLALLVNTRIAGDESREFNGERSKLFESTQENLTNAMELETESLSDCVVVRQFIDKIRQENAAGGKTWSEFWESCPSRSESYLATVFDRFPAVLLEDYDLLGLIESNSQHLDSCAKFLTRDDAVRVHKHCAKKLFLSCSNNCQIFAQITPCLSTLSNVNIGGAIFVAYVGLHFAHQAFKRLTLSVSPQGARSDRDDGDVDSELKCLWDAQYVNALTDLLLILSEVLQKPYWPQASAQQRDRFLRDWRVISTVGTEGLWQRRWPTVQRNTLLRFWLCYCSRMLCQTDFYKPALQTQISGVDNLDWFSFRLFADLIVEFMKLPKLRNSGNRLNSNYLRLIDLPDWFQALYEPDNEFSQLFVRPGCFEQDSKRFNLSGIHQLVDQFYKVKW